MLRQRYLEKPYCNLLTSFSYSFTIVLLKFLRQLPKVSYVHFYNSFFKLRRIQRLLNCHVCLILLLILFVITASVAGTKRPRIAINPPPLLPLSASLYNSFCQMFFMSYYHSNFATSVLGSRYECQNQSWPRLQAPHMSMRQLLFRSKTHQG